MDSWFSKLVGLKVFTVLGVLAILYMAVMNVSNVNVDADPLEQTPDDTSQDTKTQATPALVSGVSTGQDAATVINQIGWSKGYRETTECQASALSECGDFTEELVALLRNNRIKNVRIPQTAKVRLTKIPQNPEGISVRFVHGESEELWGATAGAPAKLERRVPISDETITVHNVGQFAACLELLERSTVTNFYRAEFTSAVTAANITLTRGETRALNFRANDFLHRFTTQAKQVQVKDKKDLGGDSKKCKAIPLAKP